jgi:RimJ/RimL family protein N-acetyltransferase
MMSKLILKKIDHTDEAIALNILKILNENYSNVAITPTAKSIQNGSVNYFEVLNGTESVGLTGFMYVTATLVETVKTLVFKDKRGMGLGGKISQAIEDYCFKNGAHKIRTTIYSYNTAMINIKLKQGYTIEGFHPDHEAIGFDEYSLGKVITR